MGQESSTRISIEAATRNLQNGGIKDLQYKAAEAFARLDAESPDDEARAMRGSVIESAERVVRRIMETGEQSLPPMTG